MSSRLVFTLLFLGLLSPVTAAQGPLGGPSSPQRELKRPSSNRTWVVDALGGGDFTDLQVAIATASSGDALLVRSDLEVTGTLVLDGKGLTIIGDGLRPTITRSRYPEVVPLVIRNLQADQTIVLRNLTFQYLVLSTSNSTQAAFLLDDNAGPIWIEDCSLVYPLFYFFGGGAWNGVRATNCASLVAIRSVVTGLVGAIPGGGNVVPGRKALEAVDSSVHLYESFVRGPDAGYLGNAVGEGGPAVVLTSSFFFAAGSELVGGRGGSCVCSNQVFGKTGSGLSIDALSVAHLVGTTVQAGAMGGVINENCPGGTNCVDPGPTEDIVGEGTVEALRSPLRRYELDATAVPGGTATLTAEGPVGEIVLSLIGYAPDANYLSLHQGVQLVAAPLRIVTEGTIPASGTLTRSVPIPLTLLALGSYQTFQQGFFFTPAGEAFLGSGSTLLLPGFGPKTPIFRSRVDALHRRAPDAWGVGRVDAHRVESW